MAKIIINLIRHGKTPGNEKHIFLGCKIDEGLSENGIAEVKKAIGHYECFDRLYTSPMKRCIETAQLLFGANQPIETIENLKEMDFGIFDGKTHSEIIANPKYSDFGMSAEKMYFPEGERLEEFATRCAKAIDEIIAKGESCAVVCHGGVIMAIMQYITKGEVSFYDALTKNVEGYQLIIDGSEISFNKLTIG